MKVIIINLAIGIGIGFLLIASIGGFEDQIELWIR